MLEYSPYNLDLTHTNFHLFGLLKNTFYRQFQWWYRNLTGTCSISVSSLKCTCGCNNSWERSMIQDSRYSQCGDVKVRYLKCSGCESQLKTQVFRYEEDYLVKQMMVPCNYLVVSTISTFVIYLQTFPHSKYLKIIIILFYRVLLRKT